LKSHFIGSQSELRLKSLDAAHRIAHRSFVCYTLPMTLEQTVTIPADRRLYLELPETLKPGTAQIVLTVTHIEEPRPLTQAEFEAGLPCPMDHTPNAETLAAMREVQDIIDGKIHAKSMSVEEFLKDLQS
jgi:hypothetical protein